MRVRNFGFFLLKFEEEEVIKIENIELKLVIIILEIYKKLDNEEVENFVFQVNLEQRGVSG